MNNVKYTTESFKEEFMIDPQDIVSCLKDLHLNLQVEINGICYNLDSLLCDTGNYVTGGYRVVRELSEGWEYHTGEPDYPVPYDSGCDLWEGHQLELRIDLINYIIKQLEEITNE